MDLRALFLILSLVSALSGAPAASAGPIDWCRGRYASFVQGYRVLADDEVLLASGAARREALPSRGMRVLVWNAYKAQKPEFRSEFDALTRRADLALIQEAVADSGTRRPFPSIQGLQWRMAAAFAQEERSLAGVATGSSAPASAARYIRSEPREPITKTPKMVLVTKHRVEGSADELLAINVHAINFVSTGSFRKHLAQIEEAIRTHSGPLLLAGDFNTWSPGRLKALRDLARRAGLRSVYPEGDGRILPLDHVFSRGVTVREARLVNESRGSDHKPIELVLDVAPFLSQ